MPNATYQSIYLETELSPQSFRLSFQGMFVKLTGKEHTFSCLEDKKTISGLI